MQPARENKHYRKSTKAKERQYRDIRTGFRASDIAEAAAALRRGRLIIAPTDTMYGLLADARQWESIRSIFHIKGRSLAKPLPMICASASQAGRFARMTPLAAQLAAAFWPGPLAIVLEANLRELPANVPARDGTIVLRVPANDFCRALAEALGGPLSATSVNLSGRAPATSIAEIDRHIAENVALIYDAGPCPSATPSTIIRLDGAAIEILRPGIVSEQTIRARLGDAVSEIR